jgi:hypothetical protein
MYLLLPSLAVEDGFVQWLTLHKFMQVMLRVPRKGHSKSLGSLFLHLGSVRLESQIFDLRSAKLKKGNERTV